MWAETENVVEGKWSDVVSSGNIRNGQSPMKCMEGLQEMIKCVPTIRQMWLKDGDIILDCPQNNPAEVDSGTSSVKIRF